MTATSLDALRTGQTVRSMSDEKMEQVRELLLGEDLRKTDERLAAIEARQREFEIAVTRRLDAMQARIDALAGETAGDRRTAFDELAQGLGELSQRVKNLSRV